MTRDEAIARGLQAGTMLDADQLGWLYDLADAAPDGLAVEVGCRRGGSVVCWSDVRQDRGPIVAVDNWFGNQRSDVRVRCLANFERYGVQARLIEMDSWNAPITLTEPVAFCFIDADHGFRGFPRDLASWPEVIMPGGVIAFHDYGVWKPTVVVKACVDAWQAEVTWEDLGIVGSAKAFRRPAGGAA